MSTEQTYREMTTEEVISFLSDLLGGGSRRIEGTTRIALGYALKRLGEQSALLTRVSELEAQVKLHKELELDALVLAGERKEEIERLNQINVERGATIERLADDLLQKHSTIAAKDRELSELRKLKFEAEGRANEKSNFFELEKARSKKLTDQNRVLREALEYARKRAFNMAKNLRMYAVGASEQEQERYANEHGLIKAIDAALSQVTTPEWRNKAKITKEETILQAMKDGIEVGEWASMQGGWVRDVGETPAPEEKKEI